MPDHDSADTRRQCIARWLNDRRIEVPLKSGRVLGMDILRLFECTAVDALPLDVLIVGRSSKRAPTRQFGVIFSSTEPTEHYPIDVFWAKCIDGNDARVELIAVQS